MILLWALIVLAVLVALAAAVALIGALLPKGHTATRRAQFSQPPDTLWQAITDFAGQVSWNPNVRRVEQLPDRDGHPVWREIDKRRQALPMETEESVPPHRLVRRIADPKLPFGGRWIYELTPAGQGAILTITEDGEIYNPVFRFVARFIMGYKATLDTYLKALGKRFGEKITPS